MNSVENKESKTLVAYCQFKHLGGGVHRDIG